MMERISIQEIAAILIEKSGLRKKDAEQFALTMFDLIKECLATDRVVKVKGLGTFKVVDIEARESVNVNTGERVLIEGHDKITFTPDNTMKELVNKPFSQFETVVLNEGVTFDDIEETPETPDAPDAPEVEQNVQEVVPEVQETLEITEPEPEPEPEPEVPETPEEPEIPESEPELLAFTAEPTEEEPTVEEQPVEEEPIADEPTAEETNEEEPIEELYMSKKMTYIALVIAIVACILSFAAGYYYRGNITPPVAADDIVATDSLPVVATDTLANDTLVADSVKNDTVASEEPKAEPVKEEAVKEEPKAEPVKKEEPKAAETEAGTDKYEKMDVRVRTGAYRIAGEDHQVKVKAGETLAKIARRTLGPDMECYLEVFNGLQSSAQLKEGQTIKIPKLELKKKKKTNNQK